MITEVGQALLPSSYKNGFFDCDNKDDKFPMHIFSEIIYLGLTPCSTQVITPNLSMAKYQKRAKSRNCIWGSYLIASGANDILSFVQIILWDSEVINYKFHCTFKSIYI